MLKVGLSRFVRLKLGWVGLGSKVAIVRFGTVWVIEVEGSRFVSPRLGQVRSALVDLIR